MLLGFPTNHISILILIASVIAHNVLLAFEL